MKYEREILLMLSKEDKQKIREIGKYVNVSNKEVIEYLLMREIYLYRYERDVFENEWRKTKGKIYKPNENNQDKESIDSRTKVKKSDSICMNQDKESIDSRTEDKKSDSTCMNQDEESINSRTKVKISDSICMNIESIAVLHAEHINKKQQMNYIISKLLHMAFKYMDKVKFSKEENETELEPKKNTYITTIWLDSMLKEMQELSGISASCICKFALFEFMCKYGSILV